jgi:hypothetical protein
MNRALEIALLVSSIMVCYAQDIKFFFRAASAALTGSVIDSGK